jgi:hypothetical protein
MFKHDDSCAAQGIMIIIIIIIIIFIIVIITSVRGANFQNRIKVFRNNFGNTIFIT